MLLPFPQHGRETWTGRSKFLRISRGGDIPLLYSGRIVFSPILNGKEVG